MGDSELYYPADGDTSASDLHIHVFGRIYDL
jgi:hypothetical protein